MPVERPTARGRVVLLSTMVLVLCSGDARSYAIRQQRSAEENGTVFVDPISPNSKKSNAVSSSVGTLLQTMGLFDVVPHYNVIQHDKRNTSLPLLTKNNNANTTESGSVDSTSETTTQIGQRPAITKSTEVTSRVNNHVVGKLLPSQPTTIARNLKNAHNNDTNQEDVPDMNERPVNFREKPEYFHTTVASFLEDVSASSPAGGTNKAVGERVLPTRRLYHHPLERTTKPNTNPMYVVVVEDRPCEGSCCRREPYSGKCRLALNCAVEHLLRTDNTKLTCGTTYQTVLSTTQPPKPQSPLQPELQTPHHAPVNFTAIPDSIEIIRQPVLDIPESVETIRQPVAAIPDSIETIQNPVPDISIISSFPDEAQEDNSTSKELDEDREIVSSDDDNLKDTPWVTVNTSVESINTYIHNILIHSFDLYNLTIANNNSFTSVDHQHEFEFLNASEFSGHDGEFFSDETTDAERQLNNTWVSEGGEFDEYFTSNEDIDYNYDEYTRDPEYDYEYSEHEYDAEKDDPDEKHLVYTDRVWNDKSPGRNRSFQMETLEVESPNNLHQFGGERDAEWINEENKRRPHPILSTATEERSSERRRGEGRR